MGDPAGSSSSTVYLIFKPETRFLNVARDEVEELGVKSLRRLGRGDVLPSHLIAWKKLRVNPSAQDRELSHCLVWVYSFPASLMWFTINRSTSICKQICMYC